MNTSSTTPSTTNTTKPAHNVSSKALSATELPIRSFGLSEPPKSINSIIGELEIPEYRRLYIYLDPEYTT